MRQSRKSPGRFSPQEQNAATGLRMAWPHRSPVGSGHLSPTTPRAPKDWSGLYRLTPGRYCPKIDDDLRVSSLLVSHGTKTNSFAFSIARANWGSPSAWMNSMATLNSETEGERPKHNSYARATWLVRSEPPPRPSARPRDRPVASRTDC